MNTKTTTDSIAIRRALGEDAELVGETGMGDNRMRLFRSRTTGAEAIETNAEPIWESEEGFADLRTKIVGGGRPVLTIDLDSRGDIAVRDEQGNTLSTHRRYCNPAALSQAVCDAEMRGTIDWTNSQVARPE